MSKWISVKDRLPDLDVEVLIFNGEIYKGFRTDMYGPWIWTHYDYMPTHDVTHWIPLPEPPKETA